MGEAGDKPEEVQELIAFLLSVEGDKSRVQDLERVE